MPGQQDRPYIAHGNPDEGETFDTPSTAEVLQADDDEIRSVPVHLTNSVRVDQLPSKLGMVQTIVGPGYATNPVKLLPANPRRAAITFAASALSWRWAPTENAVRRADSSYVILVNQGPHRFHFTGEVWLMEHAVPGATDALAICTEDWAR